MTTVKAHHRIITSECRKNKGEDGALDEAIASARTAVCELYDAWPRDSGAKIHIKVEVEYP